MRILILLLSFLNFYCNAHPPATIIPAGKDTVGGEKKSTLPKDTIETKNNTEFIIQLRASMGSGNQWMLEDSLDVDYITLIRSTFATDSTEMAGKPDLQTFVFKALQKGTSAISFIYKRPWEKKPAANAERKKYHIKIN